MSDYKISGLAIEKASLVDKLSRVPKSDTFASILLMGKIKAIQREIDASYPKPSK